MSYHREELASVCEIIMGQAPSGDAYNEEGKGYPLVAGAGDFGPLYPSVKKHTTEASKLSKSGDIILGIRASIGSKVLSDKEYCLGRGVAGLRSGPQLNTRYLWHWLEEVRLELLSKGRGATFLQVNRKDIRELQIPLPPLAEQKRIAAILDAADALRAKRREALAQLDALLQSTFLNLFGDPVTNPMGWPMVTIGDLLSSTAYGTSKKAHEEESGFPCLRMNNITYAGGWDFSSLKYVDLEPKEVSKNTVHKGQILFNRTNSKELVGKTAVYRRDEPMAFAGYLVRGITNAEADSEYIAAFLNLPQGKTILQGMCKSIVGMANINAQEFKSIPLPKPPLPIQQKFAAIVESVERQKAAQRAHLAELDALFAALQHRAFRGEL
jgi:type I restriction enzyme S subunit